MYHKTKHNFEDEFMSYDIFYISNIQELHQFMMKYNDWADGKLEYDLMVSSGHKMVWERISWDMHISHFQSSYIDWEWDES